MIDFITMFDKALEIATEAHKGQFRDDIESEDGMYVLGGEEYIKHSKRIAAKFKDETGKTVAILHDVLEDCDKKYYDQLKAFLPKAVFNMLLNLTRIKNESYFDYIFRIRNSDNIMVIEVKLTDLNDNLRDIKEGSRADKYRFARYILGKKLSDLEDAINGAGFDKIWRDYSRK